MFLNYHKSSPWIKLLISILIPIFLACIFGVAEVLYMHATGLSNEAMKGSREIMELIQSTSTLFVFCGGALLAALMISPKPMRFLQADRISGWRTLLMACAALLAFQPLVSLTATLNEQMTFPESFNKVLELMRELEDEAKEITELMVKGKGAGSLLTAILVMAIIPGLCEELYFRGLLQNVFRGMTKSIHASVWITAVIFSFIHFQFFGFVPRVLLGALLGYILVYSGSVWTNVIAHTLNNALAVVVLWVTVNYPEMGSVADIGAETLPLTVGVVLFALCGLAVTVACLYYIKKTNPIKMMEKRNIAVVCGGYSSEAEVSMRSAAGIMSFIDPERYDTTMVVITKNEWYAKISETERYDIDKNYFGYIDGKGVKHTFDFAYITIHGTPGENGILQGYFELIGMKYSCCGPLAASLSFNKFVCNRYLHGFGANIAKSVLLRHGDAIDTDAIEKELGLPMFVKSNVGGSSYGVTKVKESEQIMPAIDKAFKEGDEVIIESFLKGTELTCGMYKTKDKTVVFPLTEVVSANEFFDYDAKYNGQVQEITPARLSPEKTAEVQELTKKYYSLMGCKGIVRIDYIITEDGVPHILEANTTPGMTPTSFIPQQVRAAGIDIKDVMTDIIEDQFSI
ncbi:MAG: D-alanine--D-alanine ligase [Paludibacteraceae bacterium]|nr:D-alanine--D-alanine ligase [Paludibacteraceae bacterium]